MPEAERRPARAGVRAENGHSLRPYTVAAGRRLLITRPEITLGAK